MPRIDLIKTSPLDDTYRVAKVQGMFDIPRATKTSFHINIDIDLTEHPWTLGLITGASGSGKTTLAKHLFELTPEPQWTHSSIVDDFPEQMTPQQVVDTLTSVGLSSPPTWLRPYTALSTGQQFRATLARHLATPQLTVMDEFSSTVDRTVAKVASTALRKRINATNKPFVAVTCHNDITEWLQPDWVIDTNTNSLTWRSVQPRPQVKLHIYKGNRTAWPLFSGHHYMTASLNPAAQIYLAYATIDGQEHLVGFFSVLPSMGHTGWRRGHRTVVLPDYQGLGIGNRMIETVAEHMWDTEQLRFRATTSAPSLVKYRLKHPDKWRLASKPTNRAQPGATGRAKKTSAGRLTTSWVYIPTKLRPTSTQTKQKLPELG